jgi:hypothetical protein
MHLRNRLLAPFVEVSRRLFHRWQLALVILFFFAATFYRRFSCDTFTSAVIDARP